MVDDAPNLAVIFIGWVLGDELIGLAEIDDGRHIARFCGRDLGVIGRDLRFHPFAPPRAQRRSGVETEKGKE